MKANRNTVQAYAFETRMMIGCGTAGGIAIAALVLFLLQMPLL